MSGVFRDSRESHGTTHGGHLLIALHGDAYTGACFSVAGSAVDSSVDIVGHDGFHVLTVGRPGYGGSDLLPEAGNSCAGQPSCSTRPSPSSSPATPSGQLVLVGHSIGGMTAT